MDQDFVEVIRRMVDEQGKELLLNGKVKAFLSDYCKGQFKKEANVFRQILEAGCGEHINNADNVLERKRKLMEKLENDEGLSPKATADYLDLLGLILKGDMSKCGEEVAPTKKKQSAPKEKEKTQTVPITNYESVEEINERGVAYCKIGQYDEAIKEFSKTIRLNPNNAICYSNRGAAYNFKGEYDEAIRDLNEAIRLNPNNANSYGDRGFAYGNKSQYDEAIKDFSKAIRLNPNNANSYSCRGSLYMKKGEANHAILDFNKALSLNPSLDWVRKQLQQLL